MARVDSESNEEKTLYSLARLIYSRKVVDAKIFSVKTEEGSLFMRQMAFKTIEKKLAKKNEELQEVRDTRKKLDDKEKSDNNNNQIYVINQKDLKRNNHNNNAYKELIDITKKNVNQILSKKII